MLCRGLSRYGTLLKLPIKPLRCVARNGWFHTTSRFRSQDEPLHILFCGADSYSVESLKAVHAISKIPSSNISSIDVVTKKDKRSGRGLKVLKSTPVKPVALELGLPLHQIDTFTGWKPPSYGNKDINLIIAVSFGLLIPPRILNNSKYGGLNVHPSILPDLRGAAPIQWTIINGRTHTGVTIQTLHPSKFDEGRILDQTAPPGIEIPNLDNIEFEQLRDLLAPIGAQLLVKALQRKLYLSPADSTTNDASQTLTELSSAPRITTQDRAIDFQTMTLDDILRRNRALKRLFAFSGKAGGIRIVFGIEMRASTNEGIPVALQQLVWKIPLGVPYAVTGASDDINQHTAPIHINVKSNDSSIHLLIPNITVAGSPSTPAAAAAARNHLFREPLL